MQQPEDIILTEISQPQKDKSFMSPLLQGIKNSQTHRTGN